MNTLKQKWILDKAGFLWHKKVWNCKVPKLCTERSDKCYIPKEILGLQYKSLNVISLGQIKSDNINWMTSWINEFPLVNVTFGMWSPINID